MFEQKVGSAELVDNVGEGGFDDWNSCDLGLGLGFCCNSLDNSFKSTEDASHERLCGWLVATV